MLRGLRIQLVVAKGAENRQETKHRVVRVVSCLGGNPIRLAAGLEASDWPGQRRSRHDVNLPRNLGKVSQGRTGQSLLVFAIW